MLNFDEIKQLIDIVCERDLGGIEIEETGFRLKIEGPKATVVHAVAPSPPTGSPPALAAVAEPAPKKTAASSDNEHVINSPIVGTFYSAPNPDAEPYVQVGDQVAPGQVLCIIEAMKLMNEIEADVAGEIVRILPKNAQPVEYGEPLFAIKPS